MGHGSRVMDKNFESIHRARLAARGSRLKHRDEVHFQILCLSMTHDPCPMTLGVRHG
jgi:hypothetical protein